jgi:hypothetical protein
MSMGGKNTVCRGIYKPIMVNIRCRSLISLITGLGGSVADPDPDLYPSRILNQQQQKRRKKEIWCLTLFCSHKLHKIKNYFIFEQAQKKFEPIDKELYYFLPKNCH